MADIKFVNPATYLKNVTRSISYSALDITKDMVPAGKDLLDTNSETLKEVLNAVKRPKKSLVSLGSQFKKSKIYEAGELAVKATLEDIATGNFYNKQRIAEIESRASGTGGLADFSDMEIDFDQLDADIAAMQNEDDEDKVTKGDKYIGEMIGESSFASSQAISKSVIASGKYVAETNKSSTRLMYNLNIKGFEMINRGVVSVNQNVSHLVDFANVTIKDYMQKTLQQHDKMIKLQEEQTVLLKNIHDMQAALQPKKGEQKESKGNRYEDVMSGDSLDIKAYAKLVAKNIMEETPLKSLSSINSMGGGDGANLLLTFASSPLKAVTDFLIKKAIPDLMKKQLDQFNSTLSGFFGTILYRLSNANEDSFIGSWIKKIFGVKSSVKTSIDTSKYEKGPVPFDGITRKAIIETIPGYLARIESALINQDERFYDYKNGVWKNKEDINREISNIEKNAIDSATGDVKREMKRRLIKRKKFDDEYDLRDYMQNLDKLMAGLYKGNKNGKFFSPTNDKLTGSDFDIPDKIFKELQGVFKDLPRQLQTALYPSIMRVKDQHNRTMNNLEESGDSIYHLGFNNSGSLNKYDKKTGKRIGNGLAIGNLAEQTDRYGKNVFYWLKYQSEQLLEIANNTRGRGGKSKPGEEDNRSFNSKLNLVRQETVEDKLRKESYKEYEILYRENQRSIKKLEEKGYKIPNPRDYDEGKFGDVNDYIADLRKSIRIIEEMEAEAKEDNSSKPNKPGFLRKLQGYLDTPGKLITDIFKNADERLYQLMFGDTKEFTTINGEPVGSVLEIAKIRINEFFDDLSERIKKIFNPVWEKLKEFLSPYVEKAKEAARPLWESTKDAFKSAGGWLKGGFKEVYEPVRNLFDPSDGTWGMETRVPNIDDVDMLADGTRVMKKTGLAVLSEGEMVIPQHLNPFYKGKRTTKQQQRRNEKLVKENLASQLASNAAKYIPGYNDGTTNAKPMDPDKLKKEKDPKYMNIDGKWYNFKTEKEVSREEVERYNITTSVFSEAGKEVAKGAKKLFNEIRTVFVGEDEGVKIKEKIDNASSQLFKDAVGEIKGDKIGFGGKALAGAAIGIGGSLLTGGIMAPMLAASLGSASAIVINSEKTRAWLFGKENEDGDYEGGVLPPKLVKGITKYIPSMAKHGAVGALTAMIPFVPGGPIAGLMVGSAVGFMKKNEDAQNFLFGEDGLLGKSKEEVSKAIKEKMPRILGGAGLGAATGLVLGGPFGLVGNMMIGGGLGFLSTNEKFQKVLFGEKDENGKTIKDGLVQKLAKWTKRNIVDQLKDFIKPALNRITHFIGRLGKGAGGFFSKQFEKWVGIPLSRAMEEYIFKPLGKIAKPFLKVGKVMVKALVSPLSVLGGMGRHMQRKDLKKGNSAYLGNAADRLKRREELGMGNNDFYGQLDQVLQGMSKDELEETADLIKQTHTERISNNKNRVKARKELNMNLDKEMRGDFKIKDIKKVSQLIQDGRYNDAKKLINAKLPIGKQRGRFARAGNTEELNNILNEYGYNFKEQVGYSNRYEDKLKKALTDKFGRHNPLVKSLMKGQSGELIKMLNKEAASRTPEENQLAEANAQENKFRHTLLDDIKAIRDVITGVRKPRTRKIKKKGGATAEEVSPNENITDAEGNPIVNAEGEEGKPRPRIFNAAKKSLRGAPKAAQSIVNNLYGASAGHLYGNDNNNEKGPATRRFKMPQKPGQSTINGLYGSSAGALYGARKSAAEEAKYGEEVEKKTKRKTIFTKDGVMEYIRNTRGEWTPDTTSDATRDTMKDESAEDSNLAKSATFSEKLFNFFSRKNKKGEEEEDDEPQGILGWLKTKAGPLLKKILAGVAAVSAAGLGMAAMGHGMETVSDLNIGSKVSTWLFGGTDEDGVTREGFLPKVGTFFIKNVPQMVKKFNQILVDTIIEGSTWVKKNSDLVSKWISDGIQMFTDNLIGIIGKAPIIAEALAGILPNLVQPLAASIPPLVMALTENIGPIMTSLGSALPEIGKSLGAAMGSLLKQVPSIVASVFSACRQILPELAKGLKNTLVALVKGLFLPVYADTGSSSSSSSSSTNKAIPIFGPDGKIIGYDNGLAGADNNFQNGKYETTGAFTIGQQMYRNFKQNRLNGADVTESVKSSWNNSFAKNMFSTGGSGDSSDDYVDDSSWFYDDTSSSDSYGSDMYIPTDYEMEYGDGAVQVNGYYKGRQVDRNRHNKAIDQANSRKTIQTSLGFTSQKIQDVAKYKGQPVYTVYQADEQGYIRQVQVAPGDPRYKELQDYYKENPSEVNAQEPPVVVNDPSAGGKSKESVIISAVHATRLGLISTKSGRMLLTLGCKTMGEKKAVYDLLKRQSNRGLNKVTKKSLKVAKQAYDSTIGAHKAKKYAFKKAEAQAIVDGESDRAARRAGKKAGRAAAREKRVTGRFFNRMKKNFKERVLGIEEKPIITKESKIATASKKLDDKVSKFFAKVSTDIMHPEKKADRKADRKAERKSKRQAGKDKRAQVRKNAKELAEEQKEASFINKWWEKVTNKDGAEATKKSTKKSKPKGKKTKTVKPKVKEANAKFKKIITEAITKGFERLRSLPGISKYLSKLSGKSAKTFLNKLIPKVIAKSAKAGLKALATVLSSGLFNAVLAVVKFTDGMLNADAYLKVENATFSQKVLAGLALAINEFVLFGLLPEDLILELLINTVGKAMGIDEEIKAQQEELADLAAEYNDKNGTNYGVEEFSENVLNNKKGIFGFMTKNNGGKTANSYGELQQNVNNGNTGKGKGKGKSGTGTSSRRSGKGSAISSLVSSIDPSAPKPILAQVDKRIANEKFGNSTVGESGCAPSSAAILLNDGLQKKEVDIRDTMKSAVRFQNPDGSVRSDYFKSIFSKYGYSTSYYDSASEALGHLKRGEEVILLGKDIGNTTKNKSPFGPKSHYVVANNFRKGKVTIADPETDGQVAYDQKILKNVELAIVPKRAKSGSGSGLPIGGFAGAGSSTVKKNKDIIFNYLVTNIGLSKAGAVGVMGNMQQESGFIPDKGEIGYSAQAGGYGLCQWTNYPRNNPNGRKTRLYTFAKKKGKSAGDLTVQLEYLHKELKKKVFKSLLKRLKSYPDTEQGAYKATDDFLKEFERPGAAFSIESKKRRKFTKSLWAEYKDKTGSLVSVSSSSSGNDIGSIFSSLTSDLMKQYYGEDVLSLFGMSSSENGDSSGSMNSEGEIISNSNAKTAKKYFTQSMKGSSVTSGYGNRILEGKPDFHRGIDIGAKAGTKIPTPVSGKVVRSEYAGSYGNLLVIKDKDGYYHYFAHQQKKPSLSVGATVSKGQNVGLVGSTGHSTGPHLHYEVRKKNNQDSTNPDAYLKSYYKKGGSGSGLISPYVNAKMEKYSPEGAKGGGSDYSIDIQILQSLVSVISNILTDTHNIGEIKNLLAQYFALDSESNNGKKSNKSKSKKAVKEEYAPAMNIINTNNNSNENTNEKKKAILQQLQALIAQ